MNKLFLSHLLFFRKNHKPVQAGMRKNAGEKAPDHTKPPRAVLGAARAVAAVKNYRDK